MTLAQIQESVYDAVMKKLGVEELTDAQKQVAMGYADAWLFGTNVWKQNENDVLEARDLRFRSPQVSLSEATSLIRCGPQEYNEYTLTIGLEILGSLPEDAMISFGRQGSPCLYIYGVRGLLSRMRNISYADEIQYVDKDTLRLWWD